MAQSHNLSNPQSRLLHTTYTWINKGLTNSHALKCIDQAFLSLKLRIRVLATTTSQISVTDLWRQAAEFNSNGFLPSCWPSLNLLRIGVGLIALSTITLLFVSQVRATQVDLFAPASSQLQTIYEKAGFDDIIVSQAYSTDPRLVIAGLVDSELQRQDARRIADAYTDEISDYRIQISEQMVEAIEEVLHQLGLDNLKTQYAGNGEIVFSGYVGNDQQWQEARSLLKRDFQHIQSINDSKVTTLEVRLKTLQKLLLDAGLQSKLNTVLKNQDVFISGNLDHAELSAWKQTATEFRKEFGTQPRLISNVSLLKRGQRPSLEISGTMVAANKRFVVTTSGAVYTEGQSLPDGSLIKRIEDKRIILRRQNHDFVYPFYGRG